MLTASDVSKRLVIWRLLLEYANLQKCNGKLCCGKQYFPGRSAWEGVSQQLTPQPAEITRLRNIKLAQSSCAQRDAAEVNTSTLHCKWAAGDIHIATRLPFACTKYAQKQEWLGNDKFITSLAKRIVKLLYPMKATTTLAYTRTWRKLDFPVYKCEAVYQSLLVLR